MKYLQDDRLSELTGRLQRGLDDVSSQQQQPSSSSSSSLSPMTSPAAAAAAAMPLVVPPPASDAVLTTAAAEAEEPAGAAEEEEPARRDRRRGTAAASSAATTTSPYYSQNNNISSGGGTRGRRRRRVRGRIEAYTTKRAGTDKKYAAEMGARFVEWQERVENRLAAAAAAAARQQQEQPQQQEQEQAGLSFRSRNYRQDLLSLKRKRSLSCNDFPDIAAAAAADEARAGEEVRAPNVVVVGDDINNGNHRKRRRSRAVSFDAAAKRLDDDDDDDVAFRAFQTPLGDMRDLGVRRLLTDLILTLNMSFPDYDFGACVSPHDFERLSLLEVADEVQRKFGGCGFGGCGGFGGTAQQQQRQSNAPVALPRTVSGGTAPSALTSTTTGFASELWSALDNVIRLRDCEAYRWKIGPDNESLLLGDDDDDLYEDEDMYESDTYQRRAAYDGGDGGAGDFGGGGGAGSVGEGGSRDNGDGGEGPRVLLWSSYYLFANKSLKRIVFFGCCETMSQFDEPSRLQMMGDEDGSRHPTLVDGSGMGTNSTVDDDDDGDDVVVIGDEADLVSEDLDNGQGDDGSSSSPDDFDLDPSSCQAGGIPVTSI